MRAQEIPQAAARRRTDDKEIETTSLAARHSWRSWHLPAWRPEPPRSRAVPESRKHKTQPRKLKIREAMKLLTEEEWRSGSTTMT